jgi:hypothetical protein
MAEESKNSSRLEMLKEWQRAILWVLEAKQRIELDDTMMPTTYEDLAGKEVSDVYKQAKAELPDFSKLVEREWQRVKDAWASASKSWGPTTRYLKFEDLIRKINAYERYCEAETQAKRNRRKATRKAPAEYVTPRRNDNYTTERNFSEILLPPSAQQPTSAPSPQQPTSAPSPQQPTPGSPVQQPTPGSPVQQPTSGSPVQPPTPGSAELIPASPVQQSSVEQSPRQVEQSQASVEQQVDQSQASVEQSQTSTTNEEQAADDTDEQDPEEEHVNSSSDSEPPLVEAAPPKRKRGRPPKTKTGRPRGRPRKVQNPPKINPPEPPRRRGRPPKNKDQHLPVADFEQAHQEEVTATTVAEVSGAEQTPPKRKRGRPRKNFVPAAELQMQQASAKRPLEYNSDDGLEPKRAKKASDVEELRANIKKSCTQLEGCVSVINNSELSEQEKHQELARVRNCISNLAQRLGPTKTQWHGSAEFFEHRATLLAGLVKLYQLYIAGDYEQYSTQEAVVGDLRSKTVIVEMAPPDTREQFEKLLEEDDIDIDYIGTHSNESTTEFRKLSDQFSMISQQSHGDFEGLLKQREHLGKICNRMHILSSKISDGDDRKEAKERLIQVDAKLEELFECVLARSKQSSITEIPPPRAPAVTEIPELPPAPGPDASIVDKLSYYGENFTFVKISKTLCPRSNDYSPHDFRIGHLFEPIIEAPSSLEMETRYFVSPKTIVLKVRLMGYIRGDGEYYLEPYKGEVILVEASSVEPARVEPLRIDYKSFTHFYKLL